MTPETERYLKTASLPLAAYLFAKGVDLVSVNVEGRFGLFTFVRSPEAELWQGEFEREPVALVDARQYFNSLRSLQTERQEQQMKSHAGKAKDSS